MRRIDREPLTIDAETVADYLRNRGQEGSAEFVIHLGRQVAEANRREAALIRQLDDLHRKYEPRVIDRPRNYQPPPEASG